MRFLRALAWLAVAVLAIGSTVQAEDLHARIDRYMEASMKLDHFMGSVLVARHGRIILSKGYGMADLRLRIPNTPATEFRIASNTKQFTATAILELAARGKLRVQDPICRYVPRCPADWRPIRIYNLLTHTSGIPDYTSLPVYPQIERRPITPAGLLALFQHKPLEFVPGARFKYSNSGYVVLGYIIERVSGESYRNFLEQSIFDPLGMTHSGYDRSRPAKGHALGYLYTPGGYQPVHFVNMSVPFSAGALYSTVLDLYRWDRALHAGQLLPGPLLQEMLSPQVAIGGRLGHLLGGGGAHYGFGWFISSEFGHEEISHEGGIEGFTSVNSWFPKDDAYIIVLDNVTSPVIFDIDRSLAAILFGKKYQIPGDYHALKLAPQALQRFVGRYQLDPHLIITIRREGDQLTLQGTGQAQARIFAASNNEFYLKSIDARLTFDENAAHQVTGFVLHQNGRDMPAKRMSGVVPPQPEVIALPPATLQRYAGKYQLAASPAWTPAGLQCAAKPAGSVVTVAVADDHLTVQPAGQPPVPIYPQSSRQFFLRNFDADITFVENAEGEPTGLAFRWGECTTQAKRID
jgi:CubicO group peptidase (beta-lactamase class C family)